MNISSKLNQTAVYWSPKGTNELGFNTYATPVEVACRWQDGVDLKVADLSENTLGKVTVYVDGSQSIIADGFMFLGELTDITSPGDADPSKLDGAYRVMRPFDSPSVNASQSLGKVILGS